MALLGACWGSFAATITERWPAGESIVRPRSRCASCNVDLRSRDLVPLFSYLLSRGRCRACRAQIPPRYPMIEGASLAIGFFSAALLPFPQAFWIAVLGWQLLLLAILDAEHFWLPDFLVGSLALTGILCATLVGTDAVAESLLGGSVGFSSLCAVAMAYKYFRGRTGMGGGDPKLFGAIGIWTGWQALPLILLSAALVGIVAILLAAIRSRPNISLNLRRVPFGTCLALCAWVYCLLAMVNSPVIQAIPMAS